MRTARYWVCTAVLLALVLAWPLSLISPSHAQGGGSSSGRPAGSFYIQLVEISQVPPRISSGQTAEMRVKVRLTPREWFSPTYTLSVLCTYRDVSNQSFQTSYSTSPFSINLSEVVREARVSVPIPLQHIYVTGSLKVNGVPVTPSSVTSRSVTVWLSVPYAQQDRVVSITVQRQ